MRHWGVGLILAVLLSCLPVNGLSTETEHGHHHQSQPEGHAHHGTHKHRQWLSPPAPYVGKESHRWGDAGAIERGRPLYDTHCTLCHGADGRGTTDFARTLSHQPADLTHHFHPHPGDGDAYLYWRVSEGGTVEPFQSAGSLMPAFKTLLSDDEIWDVLAYICAEFHLGFQ